MTRPNIDLNEALARSSEKYRKLGERAERFATIAGTFFLAAFLAYVGHVYSQDDFPGLSTALAIAAVAAVIAGAAFLLLSLHLHLRRYLLRRRPGQGSGAGEAGEADHEEPDNRDEER